MSWQANIKLVTITIVDATYDYNDDYDIALIFSVSKAVCMASGTMIPFFRKKSNIMTWSFKLHSKNNFKVTDYMYAEY